MGIKKDKTIMYITYTVVLAFVLFNYKEVLNIIMNIISLATPFYIAVVIAFILNIPMKKIENLLSKKIKKKNILRGASLALTLICTALILVLFFSFIIPKLVESVILIFTNLLNYTSTLVTMINKTLEQLHIHYAMDFSDIQSLIQQNFDINNIIIKGTDFLGQTGFNIIFQSIGLVNTFINGIASFMMGLYLLANKELHITQVKKFITFIFGYKKSLSIIDIGIEANHYFNGFVSGQLLECCIFMTLMYIVLRFIGLPFPELMAVIIALSSLVPMFGTFVGFFISFILVLAAAPSLAVIFVICFICVQQFEGNVIYPHVVGDAVGISGLYVLLALVVFGNLFGFVGLLIAVPSMAVIYAIGSRVINLSLYKQHIEVTFNKISKFKDEE
jgi:Predicted permease